MGRSGGRTPPQIVAADDKSANALAAFIAQELEAAGFHVVPPGPVPSAFLVAGHLYVEVRSP